MSDPDVMDLLGRLAVALGIGFLIGVERGWRHRDAPEGTRAAGLRTHAVIGLFGGLSGALLPSIGPIGFAALTLSFAAAFILFKLRESETDNDISVTGTLAGLLVFALGAFAVAGDAQVAAAVGVVLVGLLAFKEALHTWLDELTWSELRSALIILAATAVALPVLPDRAIDPWGAINPRELWLLTILVGGASFAGYVAVRVLGDRVGVMAGAAAGALVSSTIVTAELGRRVRSGETPIIIAAAAASLAAAVSVTRVGLFVAAAATAALAEAGPALLAAALVLVAAAWLLGQRANAAPGGATEALQSPLEVASVVRFALFLGATIGAGRLISDAFGGAGLLSFAATAGLADVDAVALAAGNLVRNGLSPAIGGQAVLVAALVNTFSKAGIAVVSGGWRYAAYYSVAALAATALAAAVWCFATPHLAPMLSFEPSLAPRRIG